MGEPFYRLNTLIFNVLDHDKGKLSAVLIEPPAVDRPRFKHRSYFTADVFGQSFGYNPNQRHSVPSSAFSAYLARAEGRAPES